MINDEMSNALPGMTRCGTHLHVYVSYPFLSICQGLDASATTKDSLRTSIFRPIAAFGLPEIENTGHLNTTGTRITKYDY